VLNNLAYLMVEANVNVDEALRLAERAVQKAPDQPNFADTFGWICLRETGRTAHFRYSRGLVRNIRTIRPTGTILARRCFQKGDKPSAKGGP